ncbi:MAG: helix-turn-helix domain-containing protein [Acidobacteriota bacterium]|nr:helix-turn-helix domain-containing protein [Acidobacteriota bacterium]
MGSFGEDLRAERLARGVALEDITGVTKISQRHLMALEEGNFRSLPGGILARGIVRGYVSTIGLDPSEWVVRFLNESGPAGQQSPDGETWTEFAANVGRTRIMKREADDLRLRWIAATVGMSVVSAAAFVTVRYWGVRAGWWSTMLPLHPIVVKAQSVSISLLRLLIP